jgi:hypothetical protein
MQKRDSLGRIVVLPTATPGECSRRKFAAREQFDTALETRNKHAIEAARRYFVEACLVIPE